MIMMQLKNVFMLILALLLIVSTVRSHYYATCIGTDDPAQSSYCTDDNLYVYVCTNHGTMSGGCFYSDNQARVDVNTQTPYSRRPTTSNTMSYSSSLISIPTCSGPTAPDSICKANSVKPTHCSCSSSNWFRYGPIGQQNSATTFSAQVYGWGCQSSSVMATTSFSTALCANTYPAYDVTVPCTGSFPCPRGTSGAPSVFEGEAAGEVIAHFVSFLFVSFNPLPRCGCEDLFFTVLYRFYTKYTIIYQIYKVRRIL
jgi:hypothetical protein